MGMDLLAGLLIEVFYKPKTPVGYAIKGAIAGLIVYNLLHDSSTDSPTDSTTSNPIKE